MDKKIEKFYEGLRNDKKRAFRWKIIIAIITGLCVYGVVVYALIPRKMDVQVGSPMPSTVYASKKVEDSVSTNEVKDRVADQTPFQYTNSDTLKSQQLEGFRNYYNAVINARNYVYEQAARDDANNSIVTTALVNTANQRYSTSLTYTQLTWLTSNTQADILQMFKNAEQSLNSVVSQGLYENDVENEKEEIINAIPATNTVMRDLISAALDKHMVATMLYDEQETLAAKQKAMDNVEPIFYSKGQVVAYKGEALSQAQYDILDSLGVVGEGFNLDTNLLVGVALLLIVLFCFYYAYIYNFNYNVFGRVKYFTLSSSIIVITMVFCVVALNFKEYLMPISLSGLLTVALIDRKVALLNNIFVCGLVAIIQRNSWSFYSTFVFIISTMAGIYVFDRKKTRFGMIAAGCLCACMSFAINIAYMLIAENLGDGVTFMTFADAYKGVISIVVSTVLCLGITILFEGLFNVTTAAKLVDLSSTENHLLKELVSKAPGTYHHSMLVANLAEAAAKEVGANALLVRVGAYYHDVGKLVRPIYFKENQHGENIHDSMNPVDSAKIITGHTIEGFRLAQKEKLPREIRDIILQHHGTTYAKFFYDKAIDLGYEINENDFRYKGPKPQTKEAALIMLADVLEAVMRVGYDEENARIVIKKVVESKIKDGQLDECDLTFKDIGKVVDAFAKTFAGVYHKRVAYKGNEKLLAGEKTS